MMLLFQTTNVYSNDHVITCRHTYNCVNKAKKKIKHVILRHSFYHQIMDLSNNFFNEYYSCFSK